MTHTTPTTQAIVTPARELERARSHIAALEQLLEVHERTSLEQAMRLERSLRELDALLSSERAAREALLASEHRLRLALEAGKMGSWEWDIVSNRVYWSPEEERLYGLAPGEYAGTVEDYLERIHPDDREAAFALLREALERRAPGHHVLHRILRADGEVRWLDSHGRFVYAEDGRPLRLVGVSSDVTERIAVEQALRDREEEFRTLANSIPQLAWMTRADGWIYWYNQRWYDYTGTTFETMQGRGWQQVHHPEHVQRVTEKFARAIERGESWEDTFPLRGTDGRYRWFLSRALPIRDAQGRISRWFGTNTDITERLEIEAARDRALAEAKAERTRLQEVFMQAPAAITVLEGPTHVFTVANPRYRELTGNREVLGLTPREAFPELEGQGLLELLDRVYESGEPFAAEERAVWIDRDRDGVPEELFVDFVYQPLKNATGRTYGIMVHAVETTEKVRTRLEIERKADELARLTRALEASNHDLDQFAYVASHDLKAPLRGIANLAQWIEEDLKDQLTPESREHMQLLKGRVNRMEALIEGILAYSRAGRQRERIERVDVGRLLAETIELLAPPPGAEIIISGDMPTLDTERVPLQQVFLNLIANAIRHAQRAEVRVEITAERLDGVHRFSVADNGPGIAAEYQERIWQIFQTLSPRDKVEGTGIGLSVVRKLVDARGGRTWLESEVGRGTTFHFTWPMQPRTP